MSGRKTGPTRLAASATAGLLLGLMAASALADGGYVPEVAYAALPKIPYQRAVVVHRDGIETLIVESALESESPGAGWILPLPAEPSATEVAEPGTLTTMAVCLAPDVIHDLGRVLWWGITALVFFLPLACKAALSRRGLATLDVLLWILLFVFLLSLTGHAGGGGVYSANAQVLSTRRVGSYEVSVLRADAPEALNAWLTKEGLKPLTAEARAVANGYIEDGWCFAVARLVREAGGLATPHPLSVTFAVEKAVYPMRMTAIAGGSTHVELYVVAEGMASAKGFRTICADRLAARTMQSEGDWQLLARQTEGITLSSGAILRSRLEAETYARLFPDGVRVFVGEEAGVAVGHPALMDLMWDGCVVTRLDGDLTPRDMRTDVLLDLQPVRPCRERVFSPRGRWHAAGSVLVWGGVAFLIGVIVTCKGGRRPNRRGRWVLGALLAVTLCGSVLAAFSHRAVDVGPSDTGWGFMATQHTLGRVAEAMLADGRLRNGMTPYELAALPERIVEEGYLVPEANVNAFTGGPLRYERSPGNLFVHVLDGEEWLCTYDRHGIEMPIIALTVPPADGEEPTANEESHGDPGG
jgi:hypothetical protein